MNREELVQIVIREQLHRQKNPRRGLVRMLRALLGRFPGGINGGKAAVRSAPQNVDLLKRTLPLVTSDGPPHVVFDVIAHFADKEAEAISVPWIGFFPDPLLLPPWWKPSPVTVLKNSAFGQSQDSCRGLFVFDRGDLRFLRTLSSAPVEVLPLPCLPPAQQVWSQSGYEENDYLKLVQRGAQFLNQHAIYCIPADDSIRRTRLIDQDCAGPNYMEEEQALLQTHCFALHMKRSVDERTVGAEDAMSFIKANGCVALFHLYGHGLCVPLLQCISAAVPVLVNRLPGVVGVLGEDYPLFYASYREAIELLHAGRAIDAHAFLLEQRARAFDEFKPRFYMTDIARAFHSEFGTHVFTDHPY